MKLYVLRHGVAEDRDHRKFPNDDDRPLTLEGELKLARQAKGLNTLGLSVDVMIASPLVRAAQTAQIVRDGLSKPGQLATSTSWSRRRIRICYWKNLLQNTRPWTT